MDPAVAALVELVAAIAVAVAEEVTAVYDTYLLMRWCNSWLAI